MKSIDISFNSLTGPLPTELQALTSLKRFTVKGNTLTGPFFEPFGAAWANLENLSLDGTSLTGTIPAAVLEQWSATLVDFDLGRSLISGTIPSEISSMTKLTNLSVNSDELGGLFPEVSSLTNLGK